jgi:hypothetical protein
MHISYCSEQATERASLLDDKLTKFKSVLLRANKALEDKKREASALSESIATATAALSALQSDVVDHWCYLPPTPAPGGKDHPLLLCTFMHSPTTNQHPDFQCFFHVNRMYCLSPTGEAVAEFFVHRRLEVDSIIWCLVQVTELVDVEASNAEPPLAAVTSSAGTDSAKPDSETNPVDGENNIAKTESKADGGKSDDCSKDSPLPPVY